MPQISRPSTDGNNALFYQSGIHYDANTEAAILGVLTLERDGYARTIGLVEPEHFYMSEHAMIYQAIREMYDNGDAIDMLTICHHLRKNGVHEINGNNVNYFLCTITIDVVSGGHLEDWCLIVRELFIEREMLKIQRTAGTGTGDTVERAKAIQDLLQGALSLKTTDDWIDMSQAVLELQRHREEVKGVDMLGIPTGIPTLDKLLSGLQKTQLIVVGARPSVGKSAFATGICMNAAKQSYRVGIISLEMPTNQVTGRMAAIYSGIDFWRIFRNQHTDEKEEQYLADCLPNIAALPISLSTKTSVTGTAIRAKAEKLKRTKGMDVLIIDYLQLIESDSAGKNVMREQEIAKLSRSLKKLAMHLDIPVVVLCQVNRESEKGNEKSKKPKMSQLRESGAIEQDADVVILLDYPYKRGETTDAEGNSTQGKATIILEKSRNGETAEIPVSFQPEQMKFYEPDPMDSFKQGAQTAYTDAIRNTAPVNPPQWDDQTDLPF